MTPPPYKLLPEVEKEFDEEFKLGDRKKFKPLAHFTMRCRDEQVKSFFARVIAEEVAKARRELRGDLLVQRESLVHQQSIAIRNTHFGTAGQIQQQIDSIDALINL